MPIMPISLKLCRLSTISDSLRKGSQSRKCQEMIEWKQRVQKLRRLDAETTEKSTWKNNRYFVTFKIRIHVKISTLN